MNNNIFKEIKKKQLDILIYQLSNYTEVDSLNKLKNLKIIFYIHQSIFYWIYYNYLDFKNLYKLYHNSKYLINLIPLENNYLFKKWGIKSILMTNFIVFEYNFTIPSNLSSKIILMVGRGADKFKRFKLGIQSMEFIKQEIIECNMKIISDINNIYFLKYITENLDLESNIEFVGYTKYPEKHFKDASLHIFPSLSESFGLTLSETKMYGIPNILLGLDYLSISRGGTIIIYDDTAESISKESLKILLNDRIKNNLGKEARRNIKQFNNNHLLKKWIKLLLSIYNGDNYYENLRIEYETRISKKYLLKILKNQIILLNKRNLFYINITINNIKNFIFLENTISKKNCKFYLK